MPAESSHSWELFVRTPPRFVRGAIASFYKSGTMALTQEARDLIGSSYVGLSYNKSRNAIGLIPKHRMCLNTSFVFSKPSRGQMHLIRMRPFLEYHQLLHLAGKKFDVVTEGEIIVIQLD